MAGHAFGVAWILFAVSFATHFTDEAIHGFLPEYNSRVRMIRNKLPLLPIPTFSFASWLALLIIGFAVLLCLSPLAIVLGIFNAGLHLVGSIWYRRRVPGFYSAPLLLIASLYLLRTS
jgi:hypothetical protein